MRLHWSRLAVRDRVVIYDHIEADSPRAAIAVDDRLAERIAGLLAFPLAGRPGRVEGTRELVVVGTPYVVIYSVTDDLIRILRILHGAQRWPEDGSGETF